MPIELLGTIGTIYPRNKCGWDIWNEVTLRAIAKFFNIEICIVSLLGEGERLKSTPSYFLPSRSFLPKVTSATNDKSHDAINDGINNLTNGDAIGTSEDNNNEANNDDTTDSDTFKAHH